MSVRFTQSCPRCGRRIQVRASLLGCTVACQHCNAEFVAQNETTRPSSASEKPEIESDALMARVEKLLARSNQHTVVG